MTPPDAPASDPDQLDALRRAIAETVARRDRLKADMEEWYRGGQRGRFPGWEELAEIDRRLSELDSRFKRAYDAAG